MKYGLRVDLTGYKKLKKNLRTLSTKEIDVGFFREDKYSGNETSKRQDYNQGVHVAQIAVYNEYGSKVNNRPARPFMAVSFRDIYKDKKALGKAIASAMINGKPLDALAVLGEYYKKIIQGTADYWFMRDRNSPQWAEFKGFDKPLEFTRKMINSVKYKIRHKPASVTELKAEIKSLKSTIK